jgi:hypothetical protein
MHEESVGSQDVQLEKKYDRTKKAIYTHRWVER